MSVSNVFIAAAANRVSQAADWAPSHGVVFACHHAVALYDPEDASSRGITATLRGHTDRVNSVRFLWRGRDSNQKVVGIVSASADRTCRIWKQTPETKGWHCSAIMTGHVEAICALGVSKGRNIPGSSDFIATGSSDGSIRIWERTIGSEKEDVVECVQVIQMATKFPLALVISFLPNSEVPILICGGTDCAVTIFVKKAGQFVKSLALQGHTDWVRSLDVATFTSTRQNSSQLKTFTDGDLIIASASQDKFIRLWRMSDSTDTPSTNPTAAQNFDSSLQMLDDLVGLDGELQLSTKAHRIEADTDKGLRKFTVMFDALLIGHEDWVHSVSWQQPVIVDDIFHQPLCLLSASADKSVLIWRPDESSEVWISDVRLGEVGGNGWGFYGAVFGLNGRCVLAHGYSGSIQLWDASPETDKIWTPRVGVSGHFQSVEGLSWDPTGTFLLSVSTDQTTRLYGLWNRNGLSTWHELARPQIHGYDLTCVAFSGKWGFVSGADEKVVRVFEAPKAAVESFMQICGFSESEEFVNSRPKGANVPALGLSNKAVSTESFEPLPDMQAIFTPMAPIAISQPPFEQYLVQNTLWPESEKLYAHGFEIASLAVSPDGRLLASASRATRPEHALIRIWDTRVWKEVQGPVGRHTLSVTGLAFSPDGRWLLSCGRDRMWCLMERTEVGFGVVRWEAKAHLRIVWGCGWSHDSRLFVTGSRDKTVKIWSLEEVMKGPTDAPAQCLETIKFDTGASAVAFAPRSVSDGRYLLAIGLEDGNILLARNNNAGDVRSWERLLVFPESISHIATVKSVVWRPLVSTEKSSSLNDAAGGSGADTNVKLVLASASEDSSVRIYEIHGV